MQQRKARSIFTEGREIEIPGTGVKLWGLEPRDSEAPVVKPYRFPAALVEEIAIGLRLDLNILLVGPTGCGKTSLPVQIAAVLGRPCVRFGMDGETRVSHLRGQQRPAAEDGVLTLRFSPGMLAQAMREGWWIVLDEFEAASPAVLFTLQNVLEEGGRSLLIPETGERIEAHPEFRVFATSNTIGFRSRARSRHAGTNVMNTALVDRFGMVIAVDYPKREEEEERIKVHVPKLVEDEKGAFMVTGVCRVAEKLRQDDRFRADFSTRRCIQWARLIEQFPIADHKAKKQLPYDVLRAAQLALLRKLESPTDAKVAFEIVCRTFGYQVTGEGQAK